MLRGVVEKIDELRFNTQAEKHELSDLYESRIKRMGNAGRNGGEYYKPRPLIRAMIQVVAPKIGETIYDGACGSPKTRHDRADAARREGLDGQEAEMKAFLDDVLAAYERRGVGELSYDKLGHFIAVRYGSTTDAKQRLGDMGAIRSAFKAVQRFLYRH